MNLNLSDLHENPSFVLVKLSKFTTQKYPRLSFFSGTPKGMLLFSTHKKVNGDHAGSKVIHLRRYMKSLEFTMIFNENLSVVTLSFSFYGKVLLGHSA